MINEVLKKLSISEEINDIEIRESFDEIFSGLSNDIQTSSFLTAINEKKLEDFCMLQAILSSKEAIKKPYSVSNCENLIENITFKNDEEFISISLLQDLICSAAELNISRYCFNKPILKEKSFKLLSLIGLNFEKEIDFQSSEFEKLNFNYIYLPNTSPYIKYSENISASLPFETIFDKTIKFLNPLEAKNLFLGVKERQDVEKYASLALKLNKTNAIIINGADNCNFITPSGESYVAEAWKNKIFTYILTPELLNFESNDIRELKCENDEENINNIIEIIQNKKKGAKYNTAIINSALSLYIAKKSASIVDGINLAKNLIETNKVFEKFTQIKKFYS